MTKFEEWPDAAIDVLVGGTPCQSFSIAGLRAGLADPRGNLALTYLAIAAKYQPRWVLWENVPGVFSSLSHDAPDPCPPPDPVDMELDGQEMGTEDEYDADETHAFGTFLAGLSELGYGIAYRTLDAQFCRASGLEYAVPQRRRRVFVVGYLGDWRRAAAVLFDGKSLRGDPPPRREAGKGLATDVVPSLTASGRGIERTGDTRGQDPVVAVQTNSGDVGYCLTASAQQSLDAETETLVAHALRGEGFDASEDGTGRGTPLVPVQQPIVMMERGRGDGPVLETRQDGTANAILTPNGGRGGLGVGAIAFSSKDYGADATDNVAPTLRAMGHAESHANAGGQMAVAIQERAVSENPECGPDGSGVRADGASYTMEARSVPQAVAYDFANITAPVNRQNRKPGDPCHTFARDNADRATLVESTDNGWAVRRLTPMECERLMGFEDGYTQVPYRGKAAADGPRYKALGNSIAINVLRIIGERIAMVDAIRERKAA